MAGSSRQGWARPQGRPGSAGREAQAGEAGSGTECGQRGGRCPSCWPRCLRPTLLASVRHAGLSKPGTTLGPALQSHPRPASVLNCPHWEAAGWGVLPSPTLSFQKAHSKTQIVRVFYGIKLLSWSRPLHVVSTCSSHRLPAHLPVCWPPTTPMQQ